MRREEYPSDWDAIARAVKEAAGWRCQRCGVPHGADYINAQGEYVLSAQLGVHHVGIARPDGSPGDPADKSDCRVENLIALCRACHLKEERRLRHNSRRAAMIRAGQAVVW